MDTSNYDSRMHWYAFAPVFMYKFIAIFNEIDGLLLVGLFIVSLVFTVIAYKYQYRFLKPMYPRRLKHQKIFILAAFIVPVVAIIAGDQLALITLGTDATNSTFVFLGLQYSLIVAVNALYICTLGNAVFILTKGNNKVVRILGFIVRTIAWIGIALAAYIGYGISYSLRDPNTE